MYVEDLSLQYAYAQSILSKICGLQETGHKTRGHISVTDFDKERTHNGRSSLLYGELLPRGCNKAFSNNRLAVEYSTCLFDLGCGTGKVLLQAFLQFTNLQYVYGIELSSGRYQYVVISRG